MDKCFKYLILVCASIMSFACTNLDDDFSVVTPEGTKITITASREGFEPNTRTIRESDGSVEWCPLDEISVFYNNGASGGSKFTSQNTAQTAIAEFRGRLEGISAGGEDFTNGKYLYGVYPYSLDTKFNDGIVTISLPSHQSAADGTFANGLFPTIARAQGVNLAFYNICGGIKFTVSRNDITSVSFKGNNGERIAGTANVTFNSTEIPIVLDEEIESKNEIIVYAPAGGTFEVGKEYFIVAYPTNLSSGFTMTFRTSDMKEGVYTHNNAVEIERSIFGVLKQKDKDITSWTDITTNGGGTSSGIYLGIMGFNQQLYSYPIGELTTESKTGFDSFIDDLGMKNGTLLYYSVDQAINSMQTVQLPADLSTAAIVTFTDGLDQGSVMMNSSYLDNTEYLNALNNRIKNENISGIPITAFSIGIRGQDVADVTTFRNNLIKLAHSPEDYIDDNDEENATELTSMAEVNAKFKKIAKQLSQSNYIQTINLKMPGLSNGTVVRFTFDNVNSATKSTLYIEGTFNLTTRSLENVKYVGLSSTSGTTIKGVVDGIFVTFTFEKVHTDDNKLIENQFTSEWMYIPSNNIWQINSEFDKNENSDIVTEHSSVAIMLVLDCSSSLADDFVKAQANAKDFISTLYEAVGGDNGSGDGEGQDSAIYSTTPEDLTLAIWKDGKRYYLTEDEYGKANLSDAVIEGVTVVGGGESFILSLNDVQSSNICSVETATKLYGDIMPTAEQGKIISAKCTDINNAISSFGGTQLTSSLRYGYYTSSTTKNSDRMFTNCIFLHSPYYYGSLWSIDYPYIRGVRSTDYNSAIYWTDPNDLKLSVLINGERAFLSKSEYDEQKNEITAIEGIAVIAGGEKFAIHLNDAQTNSISSIETATKLYGDIMPTAEQGKIISAKCTDINNAISSFGGTQLTSSLRYGYYTSSTTKNSDRMFTNCIFLHSPYYYGSLWPIDYPYIRGVTNIE